MPQNQRAEAAALYLAKEHWGKPAQEEQKDLSNLQRYNTAPISSPNPTRKQYNTWIISFEEFNKVVKKLKRHKACGPDDVPMEVFKEMDDYQKKKVIDILNEWWIM